MSDPEFNQDDIVRLRAGVDQMSATSKELAPLLGSFHKALLEEELPLDTAKDLTVAYFGVILAGMLMPGGM